MTARPDLTGLPGTATGAPAPGMPAWFACSGCGYRPPAGTPVPLVCPSLADGDGIDHVLVRHLDAAAVAASASDDAAAEGTKAADRTAAARRTAAADGTKAADRTAAAQRTAAADADPNPFVAFRRCFHAWHAARAAGWRDAAYVDLVRRLDDAVARVDGHGFRVTPFERSDALSDSLGFSAHGGVWVKDETGNVSGSHKARHLFGTLLELEVGGALPPDAPFAIASCGNAALAAAVVARAAERRLLVFIPTDADPAVVARLRRLGAELSVCEREPSVPGDPTYLRLLRALAEGAVPFTCQGNLNAFAVQGGETLGLEIAAAAGHPGGPARIDRVIVQVGGGALASGVMAGFANAPAAGIALPGGLPRFDTVQTFGAYPLARAHDRVAARVAAGETLAAALAFAARHRPDFMWPWEEAPHSIAHGILDDETYDWQAVVGAMLRTGGRPLVVDEATLEEANRLAQRTTGIDVDPTGSAGLAGALHLARTGALDPDENVVVCFSGITRHAEPTTQKGESRS